MCVCVVFFFLYENYLFRLVVMATYIFHRLIMGKLKSGIYYQAISDILIKLLPNVPRVVLYHTYICVPTANFHWFPLKSRKENPQKLTQLSSRSHPRYLVGKRTAQKDITIDTTSDSQMNSNFPSRWSPASLTFNNYFYIFLYLYIT